MVYRVDNEEVYSKGNVLRQYILFILKQCCTVNTETIRPIDEEASIEVDYLPIHIKLMKDI